MGLLIRRIGAETGREAKRWNKREARRVTNRIQTREAQYVDWCSDRRRLERVSERWKKTRVLRGKAQCADDSVDEKGFTKWERFRSNAIDSR